MQQDLASWAVTLRQDLWRDEVPRAGLVLHGFLATAGFQALLAHKQLYRGVNMLEESSYFIPWQPYLDYVPALWTRNGESSTQHYLSSYGLSKHWESLSRIPARAALFTGFNIFILTVLYLPLSLYKGMGEKREALGPESVNDMPKATKQVWQNEIRIPEGKTRAFIISFLNLIHCSCCLSNYLLLPFRS